MPMMITTDMDESADFRSDENTQTPFHWTSEPGKQCPPCEHATQPGQKQFLNEKKQTLGKMDKSVKGAIDAPILDMVELINASADYYTTSSCSGRVIVTASTATLNGHSDHTTDIKDSVSPVVKKGLDWQFVTHEPITDVAGFIQLVKTKAEAAEPVHYDSMTMKFEPVIFHIRSRDLESGRRLLQVGLQAGFRNSGIVLGSNGRATIAFRSTASMEVPLVIDGELAVQEGYLRQLVKVANEKMHTNSHAIDRLHKALRALLDK